MPQGAFATDLEIRFGAARAFVECQHYEDALGHLEAIRDTNPTFRAEALSLLLARSYAATSRPEDARNEFQSAVSRFGSFDTRAEYAIWAMATGDTATASRLQAGIDQMTRRWNAHTRMLNASTMRRLKAAYELAERRA